MFAHNSERGSEEVFWKVRLILGSQEKGEHNL